MNPLIPLFSILAGSGGGIIDKFNYKKNKSTPFEVMSVVFFVMAAACGVYMLVKGSPWKAFTLASFGLAGAISLTSFLGNLFDFKSLKQTSMTIREPLADLEPILAASIGYIFYPAERKIIYIPVLALAVALVVFGFRKLKLRGGNAKGAHNMVLSVCFYAVLPSMYKLAMNYFAIEQILFIRLTFIFLATTLLFRPKFDKKREKKIAFGVASGLVTFMSALTWLITIKGLGVVGGSMVMMLGVAARYIVGHFVFKEKVHFLEISMSSGLIVLVVFTQLIK
jgi:drug/metabolite transporter (DMT)-like permease